MKAAYIDTSFLLAILFGEPRSRALRGVLVGFGRAFASDLLVAEALAAAAREGLDPTVVLPALRSVSLVLPQRSLEPEMAEVLRHGHLRGADLWHLACALFLADTARSDLAFLSRDKEQRRVARRLGFPTP